MDAEPTSRAAAEAPDKRAQACRRATGGAIDSERWTVDYAEAELARVLQKWSET
jgi:hypothetical protein